MVHLPFSGMRNRSSRISGRKLRMLIATLRYTPLGSAIVPIIRRQMGIVSVRALGDDARSPLPIDQRPLVSRTTRQRQNAELSVPQAPEWAITSLRLQSAYREGRVSPQELVERAIQRAKDLASLQPSLGPIHAFDEPGARQAAQASAYRFNKKETLGPLDGVVIAIKEELHVRHMACRLGTSWMSGEPSQEDAVAVARLRSAGAVIVGITPMTEYGMSPLGVNPNRNMPRNAHDPHRLPGGSSTGSAVSVATGVVPVALGFDGGGSIRIPASFNGIYGLKPTFGRIPVSGVLLGVGSTVVHMGPLGASSYDLAAFLDIVGGPDRGDSASCNPPTTQPGECVEALKRGVSGLRIGIDEREWASVSDDISAPARVALSALEREGAKLVKVSIPLAPHASAIGYLTIGIEMTAGMLVDRVEHFDEFDPYLQFLILQIDTFKPHDYVDAQRLRTRLRWQVAEVLREVDLIALPTTGCTAPEVSDLESRQGFVDPSALHAVSRFSYLGNLTGLPAGTAPVGMGLDGLPVGLQIIGDAWDDATVIQVLAHLERIGASTMIRPNSHNGPLF